MSEEIDYNSRENKIAVLMAFLDGKPWQWKHVGREDSMWKDGAESISLSHTLVYRVKPDPERILFQPKDLPPICWVRQLTQDGHTFASELVTRIGMTEIQCGNNHVWTFKALANSAEYSVDRINWKPCYKEQ